MNEFAEAIDELLDAADEAMDSAQTVKVGTRNVRAIIEEITSDEIEMAGGSAESGGFRATVRISDFPTKPAKGTSMTARDVTLPILSIIERNGATYELTAADPANEDA